MAGEPQQAKAEKLRALHTAGVLVLPNAWDAGSAAMIALAGAQAIATTSGGIAWSAGGHDGQGLTRAEMTRRIREIVAAVTIPVTADIEGGYGPAPEDVALTAEAVITVGAVGVNIEDSHAPGGPLFGPAEQAERIQAARAASASAGLSVSRASATASSMRRVLPALVGIFDGEGGMPAIEEPAGHRLGL